MTYTGSASGTFRATSATCTRQAGHLMTFATPAGAATKSGVDNVLGVNMGASGAAEWTLTLTVAAAGSNGFVAGSVPGVTVADVSGAHPQINIASTQLFAFDSAGKQTSVTATGTVVCGSVKDVP